jgi:hypothetical protein
MSGFDTIENRVPGKKVIVEMASTMYGFTAWI